MTRFARIRLENGSSVWTQDGTALGAAPWLGGTPTGQSPRGVVRAAAEPRKIVCIGRNYRAHAKEMGNDVPAEPLLFFKPPSSVLDPGGTVLLPPESERVEYEAELAVVIGKRGRRIPKERAFDHVLGYTVACDVTARDLQKKDGQWTRAKGFDTFCPLGPEIVSGIDPARLNLQLSINGQERQRGNTEDLVFDVPSLVAYVSNVMTLEPGDLILTGTPEGVGLLAPGDQVSVEIDGIAPLAFSVAAEAR